MLFLKVFQAVSKASRYRIICMDYSRVCIENPQKIVNSIKKGLIILSRLLKEKVASLSFGYVARSGIYKIANSNTSIGLGASGEIETFSQ